MRRLAGKVRDFLSAPAVAAVHEAPLRDAPAAQLQLAMTYRSMMARNEPLPTFEDVGFQAYSQTDEDGILLFLFSILGHGTRKTIEICAGNGIECLSANLIVNHGWHGLLVDGNEKNIAQAHRFYRNCPRTMIWPPVISQEWISAESVNTIVQKHGFHGEVDLLTIDLDGVDYWIWKALDVINPRVVVVEYNDILGPDRACTVPYKADFQASDYPLGEGYMNFVGASLAAFVKLGREKGYRLVGINRLGFNAFFLRNDLGRDLLPEIDAKTCFHHPKVLWGMEKRYPHVKDMPWVDV